MVRPTWSEHSSSSRRVLCAFAAGAMLCLASPAWARTPAEPIALHYEASGTCPSELDFMARVRTYTRRWALVPEGTPAVRTVRVRVSEGKVETTGKLTVATPGGATSEREIAGPSCMEVSEALAVMVAVAIDPRAGDAADASEDALEEGAAAPAPTRPPATAPLRARRPERAPRATPARDKGPRVAFDLRAETTSAVIRGGLPGVGASLRLDPSAPAVQRGVHVSEPSLALGVRQSLPKERTLRGGSVGLSWTAGHLRLCPFRVVIGAVAEVSPCAEANIGVLRASARGFAEARDLSTFWFDLGGSLWAAVSLSDRVFLSSTVLFTMPLFRQPFALASGAPVATVPPFGVLAGFGLGMKM